MDEFFPLPLAERHFEDYPVGLVATYGPALVTQESIVRFATEFDPHAMHVDADAAVGPRGGATCRRDLKPCGQLIARAHRHKKAQRVDTR